MTDTPGTEKQERAAYPALTHRDGTQCVWVGDHWFVPLDVGGEGYACQHDEHAEIDARGARPEPAWRRPYELYLSCDGQTLVANNVHQASDELRGALFGACRAGGRPMIDISCEVCDDRLSTQSMARAIEFEREHRERPHRCRVLCCGLAYPHHIDSEGCGARGVAGATS